MSASFAIVLMLRAEPLRAIGILSLDFPIPLGIDAARERTRLASSGEETSHASPGHECLRYQMNWEMEEPD